MLKKRIITGAGLTCGIAAVLLLSGHGWFLKAVSAVLSVMAAYELCRAGGYLQKNAFLLGTIAAAVFSHSSAVRSLPAWFCCLPLPLWDV